MKTDRLTLLVTPEEKAEMTARANALGISASELVRRAVQSYDPEFDEETMRALTDELAAAVRRTERRVDDALAQMEAFEAYFADVTGRRKAARAALVREGVAWPFDAPPKRPRRATKAASA